MISNEGSTNPESFIKIRRGRRIGWRFLVDTPIYIYMSELQVYCTVVFLLIKI
jgi:hypothetical protein